MSGPRRVLLVDDNLDSSDSLRELLQLSGHQVRTAADGPAALAVANEMQPEVVLCDLGLPGMNGYEVAQRLRASPLGGTVFLAALTGYGQPSDRQRSAAAGFDAHLVKPVDPFDIERLIEGLP